MRQQSLTWSVKIILCGLFVWGWKGFAQADTAQVKIFPGEQIGTVAVALGVTLTQTSLRQPGDPAALVAGKKALRAAAAYVNQFIMGWGTLNPEPSPGRFDWQSLDYRVGLMRQSGAIPVLTLCCAPDWMKGGQPDETDWGRIDEAPDPSHFEDFVELARQVALRYPDIKHYQIWSEFKGFWGTPRWHYRQYTIFYNKIYDMLKSISPEIKVGGPYAVMAHWLTKAPFFHSSLAGPYGSIDARPLEAMGYWLMHKHGADWVSVDGSVVATDALPDDLFAAEQYFSDISNWARRRTTLPLWWSEWYATPFVRAGEVDDAEQNALMSDVLIRLAPVASVALRWGPEGDARRHPEDHENLWSDTTQPGGGRPYPFFFTVKAFRKWFAPGTTLVRVVSTAPNVAVLASRSCVMVVNESDHSRIILIDGKPLKFAPYETKFVALR